ncbi:Torsin-1B [Frankliniella fusca]|uniref:Torsin-1B n=1 Tax=Frankliniella fusca TaxID=407009 RepID=A0AAE1LHA8_9NEOP|nr:Torsin-1B [Frankliniella fusca]
MSSSKLWLLRLSIIINFLGLSCAIEPITTAAVGAAIAAGVGLYDQTYCRVMECCDRHSVSHDASNITAFKRVLESSVFGQHVMQDIVVRAIEGHLKSPAPSKALVISFHGPTGCGKSYVSQFIAQSLFAKGMQSRFVKKYLGGKHFPNDSESKVALYKYELQKDISETTKKCGRALFIFEDVQKMPPKVLDALVPFMDHHEEVDKVDHRKNIFILLSNTGAKLINQKTLELWSSGKQREDITLRDFESMIRHGSFNEEGGFHKADVITSSLIDHHVPFLPLEEKHVRLCILAAFKKYGYISPPDRLVQNILDDLIFLPEGQELFSSSGCKRVEAKVGSAVQGLSFTKF